MTVSGDGVNTPANVLVPVGVKAADVIAACGGYSAEDVLLIAGGPMMGKTITTDQFVITPYSNALTVLKNKPVNQVACLVADAVQITVRPDCSRCGSIRRKSPRMWRCWKN
ncbi:MAG: SLBB domain-containing protein [Holdemania massiliensis]